MTTAAPEQTITERLVSALTAAWRAIQGEHSEVPDVVLALGSGTLGKRGGETTLGHFAAGRWQLADAGEGDQGLHELFAARGVVDTSRQGRYHNKRFKALGEELGLVITEAGTLGWSGTALGPQAQERYADVLDHLAAAMTAFRRAEVAGLPGKSKSKNLLVAECACPRKIRVARSTLDAAPITCGACGEQFTAPDDDEDGAEDSADE